MLKRFNVKNFLSFSCREEDGKSQEFAMIPGKVRNKSNHLIEENGEKILKFGAVFGGNASGKSNLVKAMNAMQKMILEGSAKGYSEKYCRIDAANKDKPSYFEMEISLEKKCYVYGFEVILNKSEFTAEWLIELKPNGSEKMIFQRDIEAKKCEFCKWEKKDLQKRTDVYQWDIAEDNSILLLSMMNENKTKLYEEFEEIRILRDVFIFLTEKINITFPNASVSGYGYLSRNNSLEEITELISAFGTGITNVLPASITISEMKEMLSKNLFSKVEADINLFKEKLKNNSGIKQGTISIRSKDGIIVITVKRDVEEEYKIFQFGHGSNGVLFHINEESDGTIRLLDLLEVLLSDENKTFIIDELDRCLHPNLTYKFIETFFQYAEKKKIQLIVTTHESRLLDFDLLRRDEIWFVNKRKSGETDLYSLDEFNERFDKKIDKAYLEGRYGGVPIFDTVFPLYGVQK